MRPISVSAIFGLGLSFALLPASASAATEEPLSEEQSSTGGEEIVVEGAKDGSGKIDAARNYLRSLEFGRLDLQAARWSDRICPKVIGMDGQIADIIVDRVRAVAAGAGVRVAPEGCVTNISIVFVDDGADFMGTLHQRAPRRLRDIPRQKKDYVLGSDAPVRWWYGIELTGQGGRRLMALEPPAVQCDGPCSPGAVLPANDDTVVLSSYNNSRVYSSTERYIRSAAVVIDRNRAAGTPVDSLADYVSMVALSEIWPKSGQNLGNSILTLFDEEPSFETASVGVNEIQTISAMDQQFLCELYQLPMDRPSRYQKGRILRGLAASEKVCAGVD